MRTDPEGLFEAAIAAYALRDLELAASYFSHDCAHTIFVSPDSHGGKVIGRSAILERFNNISREFDVLTYEAKSISVEDQAVRAQLHYVARHRASGEVIEGVGRIEATFASGKIVAWDAYHDAERIHAFLRMCRSRATSLEEQAVDEAAVLDR